MKRRRPPRGAREPLGRQLAIRLSDTDLNRLQAVAERVPIATRNAVARLALRLGLEALEKDATRIVQERRTKRASSRPSR
jgi:hypothetical protein